MIDVRRSFVFFLASMTGAVAVLTMGFAGSVSAETVITAPGVQVTKRTYAAPGNEQPFFGFAEKTDAQREADDKFVKALVQAAGTPEKALEEVARRGWRALGSGKLAEAAQRFNQAYLVAPEQSVVYHGLAAVAQMRFNDLDFAEELFRIARKQPNPLKVLNADYGRVLLVAKRPKDAQPVLEQAVRDTPDFGDAWTNLASARLQNGDRYAACVAANEAMKQRPSTNASVDLARLRNDANCR